MVQTRFAALHGEDFFEIKEVYLDEKDRPYASSEAMVCGVSIEELRDTLRMMEAALDKPVIIEKDFDGEIDVEEGSGNVWEDLGFPDAEERLARANAKWMADRQ